MGKPRKRHSGDAGYIAERMNPFVPDTKVVIYYAEQQGIDVDGKRYAVVCTAHHTICGETSLPRARVIMKNPHNFCEQCNAIDQRTQAPQPESAQDADDVWCRCDNGHPSHEHARYYEERDEQTGRVYHGWECAKCGKLIQVG